MEDNRVVNNVDVDGPIVEINEVSHTNYITLKILYIKTNMSIGLI